MPAVAASGSGDEATPTAAGSFAGTFATLKGVNSTDKSKLEYTAITGTEETGTDAYTTSLVKDETNGVYYHFYIDYMITTGKSLKVTAAATKTDGTGSVTGTDASIAQATRVGIIPAASFSKKTTGADEVGYAGTGKEYIVAEPNKNDYNLAELKETRGYTGTKSEYKSGLGDLYSKSSDVKFSNKTPLAKTSDGAFEYGSLSIYVWFDGTDYACTNVIFSQVLTMTLTFTVA